MLVSHVMLSSIQRIHTHSTIFPYTTLFRSRLLFLGRGFDTHFVAPVVVESSALARLPCFAVAFASWVAPRTRSPRKVTRSEEHTSELQSRGHLVCRLLLDKNKTNHTHNIHI